MKYVLDTDVVLALLKGNALVVTRLDVAGKRDVSVPQLAWAELAFGLLRLSPSTSKQVLKDRCALLRNELAHAPWTDEVSEKFGSIKAMLEQRGAPMDDRDVIVAAHAMASDAVLVTSNVDRMSRVDGLPLEDWTES
jgi:tRNA(fMet)-specific endonuclease VapC